MFPTLMVLARLLFCVGVAWTMVSDKIFSIRSFTVENPDGENNRTQERSYPVPARHLLLCQ